MKRYIEVGPRRSGRGGLLAFAVLALIVYGLIAHPAATADIARTIGTALAGIADAIFGFLQGL